MGSVQRRTSDLWRMCSVKLPTSWRVTTVEPAHCVTTMTESLKQAGGRQASNVVPYRKQPCGRNNILTHSHSYTHQRKHGNTHRCLQPSTRIKAYKHSFFPSTIKSWNKCTQQWANNHSTHLGGTCTQCLHTYIYDYVLLSPHKHATPPTTCDQPSSIIL